MHKTQFLARSLWLCASLSACSGVTQALGDAASGSAGSAGNTANSSGDSAGGSTLSSAGSTALGGGAASSGPAGSPDPAGPCGSGCQAGYDCFPSTADPGGVCAPLCDSQDQSAWGSSCQSSASGETGICLPFLRNIPSGTIPSAGRSTTGTGVCTRECDPLHQDCPLHFACDVTERTAGEMPDKVYACLPVVEAVPRLAGAACDGQPLGECSPGLNCMPSEASRCLAFCDLRDTASCPKSQTCSRPDWFPTTPNYIGVCSG